MKRGWEMTILAWGKCLMVSVLFDVDGVQWSSHIRSPWMDFYLKVDMFKACLIMEHILNSRPHSYGGQFFSNYSCWTPTEQHTLGEGHFYRGTFNCATYISYVRLPLTLLSFSVSVRDVLGKNLPCTLTLILHVPRTVLDEWTPFFQNVPPRLVFWWWWLRVLTESCWVKISHRCFGLRSVDWDGHRVCLTLFSYAPCPVDCNTVVLE